MRGEKDKLALVLAAKSRSLLYTSSPASPSVFASPIHTLASVPFCWEEQPGKPKNPLLPLSYPKCLELPPRLLLPGEFTQMPLPERKHGRLFGFIRRKGRGEVVVRGSYVFPSEKERAGEINNNNMKIIKFNKSGSSNQLTTQTSVQKQLVRKHFKEHGDLTPARLIRRRRNPPSL